MGVNSGFCIYFMVKNKSSLRLHGSDLQACTLDIGKSANSNATKVKKTLF